MANYLLSKKADEDMDGIADHTLEAFGENQTRLYISSLFNCFHSLSSNPDLGRSAIEYAPRLKKYKFQAHMIFYEKTLEGVFIVNIGSKARLQTSFVTNRICVLSGAFKNEILI